MSPSVSFSRPPRSPDKQRRALLVSEVSARLGITPDTVRRWVKDGLIPAQRLGPGRRILIDPDDLGRLFSNANAKAVRTDEDELADLIGGYVSATEVAVRQALTPDADSIQGGLREDAS